MPFTLGTYARTAALLLCDPIVYLFYAYNIILCSAAIAPGSALASACLNLLPNSDKCLTT